MDDPYRCNDCGETVYRDDHWKICQIRLAAEAERIADRRVEAERISREMFKSPVQRSREKNGKYNAYMKAYMRKVRAK